MHYNLASRRVVSIKAAGGALALALAFSSLAGCSTARILTNDDGGGGGATGAGGSAGSGGPTDGGVDHGLSDMRGGDSGDAPSGTGGADGGAGGRAGSGGSGGSGGIIGTGGSGGRGTGGVIVTGSGGVIGSGGMIGSGGSATGGVTGGGGLIGAGGAAGAGGATDGGVTGVTPNLAGQLVITEIMADTTAVTDDMGEWFEIHNPSTTAVYDLSGCAIFDTSNTDVINRHLLVMPGAFITLGRFADASGGFVPDYTYPTVKFSNSGDRVGLTCGITPIDIVNFALFYPVAVPHGRSISLDPRHYDSVENDLATSWCTGVTVYNSTAGGIDYGSPELTNPQCP